MSLKLCNNSSLPIVLGNKKKCLIRKFKKSKNAFISISKLFENLAIKLDLI